MDGFNLDTPLACEGIIGDGCGGGRVFSINDEKLKVYDPQTKESVTLLDDIKGAKSIAKTGCIVTIKCEGKEIKFDLSALKKV